MLSYVDDLLLAGASTEDLYEMVEMLRKEQAQGHSRPRQGWEDPFSGP